MGAQRLRQRGVSSLSLGGSSEAELGRMNRVQAGGTWSQGNLKRDEQDTDLWEKPEWGGNCRWLIAEVGLKREIGPPTLFSESLWKGQDKMK